MKYLYLLLSLLGSCAFAAEAPTLPVIERSVVTRVGQLAPDFRLMKLDGSSIALSDLRGKRVLINSWASW